MKKIILTAFMAIPLIGCAAGGGGLLRQNAYSSMTLGQALAGATLGQCASLTKDYGYGPRPPGKPPAYWQDISTIPCDADSRIGFVNVPGEGRKLVVPAVPDAIPGQCWLKEVKNFQGNRLNMHLGTAWLDPTRNSSRNDTRGKLFDCGNIPWEGGQSAAL